MLTWRCTRTQGRERRPDDRLLVTHAHPYLVLSSLYYVSVISLHEDLHKPRCTYTVAEGILHIMTTRWDSRMFWRTSLLIVFLKLFTSLVSLFDGIVKASGVGVVDVLIDVCGVWSSSGLIGTS